MFVGNDIAKSVENISQNKKTKLYLSPCYSMNLYEENINC